MKSYQLARIGAFAAKLLVPIILIVLIAGLCFFGFYLYKKHKEKKENCYEE